MVGDELDDLNKTCLHGKMVGDHHFIISIHLKTGKKTLNFKEQKSICFPKKSISRSMEKTLSNQRLTLPETNSKSP